MARWSSRTPKSGAGRDVVIDRGVVIPAGLVIGEDAEKGRVLITQPMIDKLPE